MPPTLHETCELQLGTTDMPAGRPGVRQLLAVTPFLVVTAY
ncbi:hypothetical protein [Streptomyces sp. NPDC059874]